ncbi:MAG: nuclease-related domain-containing protein [Microthrixaceae bacterium]
MNNAGDSARRVAESATRAAETLERKAANARRAAENYAKGAEGEVAVANSLAPLIAAGWYVLNDRVMPTGGNIDHIVVGPGAVVVLDAKAWNGKLEIRDGKLYNSGWNKSDVIEHLHLQGDVVQDALGADIAVNRALVVTTQPDLKPEFIGDAGILGLNSLYAELDQTPTIFSQSEVEAMFAKLAEAFPLSGTAPPAASGLQIVDGVESSELFDRANRFLYLNQWRKNGRHRVYLKDEHGEELGMKDLVTGEIKLSFHDDVLAKAVLRGATAKGVALEQGDLPKLPIDIRGGRLLGLFGRIYTTAMIGSVWNGPGKRYLYGTLANPVDGVFELGHVDLKTGWAKPKSQGPVSRDRGPAERYLALLRDRHPVRSSG